MHRFPWWWALVPAVFIFGAPALAAPREAEALRPNFIVILTDDQGYQDLGCFGSPSIKTPNIDRMAAEGLRLTHFYAQPVCGVSRAALMTGCYPMRVAEPGNQKRLHTVPHPNETTMAEMLKDAGYATALIGKWHLTLTNPNGLAGFERSTMPNAQGFDYFYGTPLFNGFTVFVEDANFRSPMFRNETIVRKSIDTWDPVTKEYTSEAIRWIEQNKSKPFFLYLAHNMPHIPVGASEQFKGRSEYGPYGDTIEEIDWSCGQILAKLTELGIDRKTMVVFTSDNGPWIETTRGMKPNGAKFIPRDHSGSADPLRGWKMSTWEGGSRVPCVIRWPAGIKSGRISDEILTTMDLFPTFARLAGVGLREDVKLDGVDAVDFLLGRTEASPRDEYLYYAGPFLAGVRVGRWKLVRPRPASPRGTGWWGRMIEAIPEHQLFDLVADPGEQRNVAASHPEVVARLKGRLAAARESLGDADRVGSEVRHDPAVPPRTTATGTPRAGGAAPVAYDKAPPVGKLRFDFETGDLAPWKVVEGEFGSPVTQQTGLPNHRRQPFNKQGKFLLFTGKRPSEELGHDGYTGVIESPMFVLTGEKMQFLVGGGAHPDTYVALCDKQGKELRKASGANGPALRRVVWDVSAWKGQVVRMRIVDRRKQGWGHVTFDDFSCEGRLVSGNP